MPVAAEGLWAKFSSFSRSTATAYQVGGICTIIVGDGNGGDFETAYDGHFSILPKTRAP
jgi:hypothetical protein